MTAPKGAFSCCFKNEMEMLVSGMQKYMVEVGLKGSSLRIEAKDQTEAIRLAKEAVSENGLLIYVQRMDKVESAENEAPRTSVIWRPGREWSDERDMKQNGMSPAMGLDR